MIVKLLTEHHLEFLSLKGGCRGSSESTLVEMPHCWKSHFNFIILKSIACFIFDQVCPKLKRILNATEMQDLIISQP